MATKTSGFSLIKGFWNFLLGLIGFVVLFFVLVNFGLFGDLPNIKELEDPKSALASEIISEDGVPIGKFYKNENRTNVGYKDIAPVVYQALIATEDVRYYEHSGIDFRGTVRALSGLGGSGGGSTITQQLSKNLFSEKPKMKITRILQKFKEWIISIRLERRYTKNEILVMYLNTVPFSGNSYGIKSAAFEFFGKSPSELKTEEAAVLVGMLKANTAYNPKLNPERSKQRRDVVLAQMAKPKAGFISEEESKKLQGLPIQLDYRNTDVDGLTHYFKDEVGKFMADWCKKNGYNLYKSGLRIHTTINSKMQAYAELAVAKHMKDLQGTFFKSWGKEQPWRYIKDWKVIPGYIESQLKRTERYAGLKEKYKGDSAAIFKALKKPVPMTIFTWNGEKDTVMSPYDSVALMKKYLHAGFCAVDPSNGDIKAWVGGVNYKYFKYDHVNKNARRQVGSTFKPIVYATAIDINKTSPCTKFPREYTTFTGYGEEPWTPRNADGTSGGEWSMYKGLANSDNLITAQVMKSLGEDGPEVVKKFAERLGIEKNRIPAVPSICLGTMELSVFEMASAFGVFVNKGLWVEPSFITRIEDKNGNVLAEFKARRQDQVLSEEKAWVMFSMLEGVVNGGTGSYLRGSKFGVKGHIGGKTGTTQGNADGWFIGACKGLVCATWVGADDPSVRFRSTWLGQGAMTALPIYGYFMQSMQKDKEIDINTDALDSPKGGITIQTDCDKVNAGEEGSIDIEGLGG